MAVLKTRISNAATRPFLSMRLNRFCATTPFSASESVCADFVLLVGRENVNDAVHRLGRALRVQRAENQVAGRGGGDGQFDGFQVAHFADEDDVRVFAQRAAQRGGKGFGVHADFAVVHQAVLAFVDEFNRVFDRDDVVFAVFVA